MRKLKFILPFVLIPILLIPYSILDVVLLVDLLGHDPYADFNANSFRRIVFAILCGIAIISGGITSRKLSSKTKIIIYNASIVILNIIYWFYIIIRFAWK
ncbi:MAG: hypothetical protein K0Q49_344 [Haloplasmataceae bacterium]|jgi:hypothetical protein|nr:hypothetical protein [Haloplasmataceae bacterium]